MHMVDERRAGGGSLISLWWITEELAEQKFSPELLEPFSTVCTKQKDVG
jgi:hypothetical protein